jgi:hypothetical protein
LSAPPPTNDLSAHIQPYRSPAAWHGKVHIDLHFRFHIPPGNSRVDTQGVPSTPHIRGLRELCILTPYIRYCRMVSMIGMSPVLFWRWCRWCRGR